MPHSMSFPLVGLSFRLVRNLSLKKDSGQARMTERVNYVVLLMNLLVITNMLF